MRLLFSLFLFLFLVPVLTNAQRGLLWSKDGDSYFTVERNAIVENRLPSFEKSIVVDSSKLVPKGKNTVLRIRSFSFNENRDKLLIYSNTKKVWRLDTKGDYWIFDLTNNTLKQLGKLRPPSSLM